MSYYATGEDEPVVITSDQRLVTIDERTAEMQREQEEDRKFRKMAMIIGGLSALFAAARLGVIAIPMISERRRTRKLGGLGE